MPSKGYVVWVIKLLSKIIYSCSLFLVELGVYRLEACGRGTTGQLALGTPETWLQCSDGDMVHDGDRVQAVTWKGGGYGEEVWKGTEKGTQYNMC